MLGLPLAFFFPIPETTANYTFAGYRWAPADAPLALDACEASGEVLRGLAYKSVVHYGTGFTITAGKTASRVQLRFTFADDHWQPVRVFNETIEGEFSPGAKVMRTHRFGGDFHVNDVIKGAGVVLCSPISVTYTDGTRWNWQPPTSPYPQPGVTPARYEHAPAPSVPPPAPIESVTPPPTSRPSPNPTLAPPRPTSPPPVVPSRAPALDYD